MLWLELLDKEEEEEVEELEDESLFEELKDSLKEPLSKEVVELELVLLGLEEEKWLFKTHEERRKAVNTRIMFIFLVILLI